VFCFAGSKLVFACLVGYCEQNVVARDSAIAGSQSQQMSPILGGLIYATAGGCKSKLGPPVIIVLSAKLKKKEISEPSLMRYEQRRLL